MLGPTLKKPIHKLLGAMGLEIRKRGPEPRMWITGSLRNVKRIGWQPGTVIDVGGAHGDFTSECHETFPDAHYIILEPLEEYAPSLAPVLQRLPKARLVKAAATSKCGQMVMNVHPDLVGSSFYLEEEESDVNGVPRTVPTVTLDSLIQDNAAAPGPYLVKLDVQGAELDVLSGASATLAKTDFLILETSLFPFYAGSPLLHDVIRFMKERGFVAYDFFSPGYRMLDGAMAQIDVVFVQESGIFRKDHKYATAEQRRQQTQAILALTQTGKGGRG